MFFYIYILVNALTYIQFYMKRYHSQNVYTPLKQQRKKYLILK